MPRTKKTAVRKTRTAKVATTRRKKPVAVKKKAVRRKVAA